MSRATLRYASKVDPPPSHRRRRTMTDHFVFACAVSVVVFLVLFFIAALGA